MTMIQLRDSSDPREEMPWKGTDGAGHIADAITSFITYAGTGYTYYCEAAPTTARSDAAWSVARKTDATGDIIYAGTGLREHRADDLATVALLTYTLGA